MPHPHHKLRKRSHLSSLITEWIGSLPLGHYSGCHYALSITFNAAFKQKRRTDCMEAYPHFQQQLADVIADIQENGFYFADQRKHLLRTLNELENTSAQADATHTDIGLIHYYIGSSVATNI